MLLEGAQKWGTPSESNRPLCAAADLLRLAPAVTKTELGQKNVATLTCRNQTQGPEKPGHLSPERWWHTAVTPSGLSSQSPQSQGEELARTPQTKVMASLQGNRLRAQFRHEVTLLTRRKL